jgi:hypothetical protein
MIHNNNPQPLTDIPLFCLLEAAGTFWYYPTWTMEPAWEIQDSIPVGQSEVILLDSFPWPDNTGSGTARFYGALTDQDITRILGNFDMRDVSWE